MTIKALLLDFDGTLVTKDMLSEVIDLVGKKQESEQINADFHAGKLTGIQPLISRINLLVGVTTEQITDKVREDLSLLPGARELIAYCKSNEISIILASGSIETILEVYKEELGIEYLVGSKPKIAEGRIQGITRAEYPENGHFKVVGISKILTKLGIVPTECMAVGDSRGDIPMFELAGVSIAINPKGGIEQHAEYVVDDLNQVLEILREKNAGGKDSLPPTS